MTQFYRRLKENMKNRLEKEKNGGKDRNVALTKLRKLTKGTRTDDEMMITRDQMINSSDGLMISSTMLGQEEKIIPQ